jgi:hypothetical protein
VLIDKTWLLTSAQFGHRYPLWHIRSLVLLEGQPWNVLCHSVGAANKLCVAPVIARSHGIRTFINRPVMELPHVSMYLLFGEPFLVKKWKNKKPLLGL